MLTEEAHQSHPVIFCQSILTRVSWNKSKTCFYFNLVLVKVLGLGAAGGWGYLQVLQVNLNRFTLTSCYCLQLFRHFVLSHLATRLGNRKPEVFFRAVSQCVSSHTSNYLTLLFPSTLLKMWGFARRDGVTPSLVKTHFERQTRGAHRTGRWKCQVTVGDRKVDKPAFLRRSSSLNSKKSSDTSQTTSLWSFPWLALKFEVFPGEMAFLYLF